jgi:acetyltransferase
MELRDGRHVLVRPIRPEDEPALRDAFRRLEPEDVRMRFFTHLRELDHSFAARLTQIDYDREMALVAVSPEQPERELWGVARIMADPDGRRAEYAIAVRSDLKGLGIGYELMQRILRYAEGRGIEQVWGDVLEENHAMLKMCRELGFELQRAPDAQQVVRVRKDLG